MAIAIGQTSKGRTGSGTSTTTAGVTTQASGSTFVLGIIFSSTNTVSSIVDSKGNTYTQIGSTVTYGGVGRALLYYSQNGTGGASHTVQVNAGSTDAITAFFLEITGGLTVGILDQGNGNADTSSPFTLTAGLTTTQAAEALVTMLAGTSASNPATHAETGLGSSTVQTSAEETNGASFWTGGFATAIKSSTGTFNPSWTESGASAAAVSLATFKEAAAAAGVQPQLMLLGVGA